MKRFSKEEKAQSNKRMQIIHSRQSRQIHINAGNVKPMVKSHICLITSQFQYCAWWRK